MYGCSFLPFAVTPVLKLCDWLRDEVLVELGIRLEDRKGKYSYTSLTLFKSTGFINILTQN